MADNSLITQFKSKRAPFTTLQAARTTGKKIVYNLSD